MRDGVQRFSISQGRLPVRSTDTSVRSVVARVCPRHPKCVIQIQHVESSEGHALVVLGQQREQVQEGQQTWPGITALSINSTDAEVNARGRCHHRHRLNIQLHCGPCPCQDWQRHLHYVRDTFPASCINGNALACLHLARPGNIRRITPNQLPLPHKRWCRSLFNTAPRFGRPRGRVDGRHLLQEQYHCPTLLCRHGRTAVAFGGTGQDLLLQVLDGLSVPLACCANRPGDPAAHAPALASQARRPWNRSAAQPRCGPGRQLPGIPADEQGQHARCHEAQDASMLAPRPRHRGGTAASGVSNL
mmetsp:Transcript_13406/g.39164  ORF Transcript_13406/g.39164 Transcript_13406/m.39164 type:complete len:303 (+) Transcript_13406:100-1008(+)